MIKAIIFDLDGTLVQTEKLKAHSYAVAVQRLRGLPEPDPRAIEAYREIVGAASDVASRHVMEKLGLKNELLL
jgi:phosphoglycolate phosphatase-like HAD superfamily hydrolase